MEWKKWPEKNRRNERTKKLHREITIRFYDDHDFFLYLQLPPLSILSLPLFQYTPPPNKTKCQFVSKFYLGLNFFWVRTRWHISLPTTVPKQTHAYNLVREKKKNLFRILSSSTCVTCLDI